VTLAGSRRRIFPARVLPLAVTDAMHREMTEKIIVPANFFVRNDPINELERWLAVEKTSYPGWTSARLAEPVCRDVSWE
jgi:hypothetical protein